MLLLFGGHALAGDRVARADERVPLAAEDVVKDVDFFPYESISPSPDGKWVAFETGDPSKAMQFDYAGQRFTKSGYPMLASALAASVWVSEITTGTAIQLASERGSNWMPSWSPDGRYLAFYSDRGGQAALWVWDRQTKTTRQVSSAAVHTSWWREIPVWSADGKTVLCKVMPEGMTLEDVLNLSPLNRHSKAAEPAAPGTAKTASVHVYTNHPADKKEAAKTEAAAPGDTEKLEGMDYLDSSYLSDLARIDIATGKMERLVRRIRPMWYAYSPDEASIAILNMDGTVPNTQQLAYSVSLYNVRDKSVRNVVARGYFDANNLTTRASWSPDGTRLAYSDTGKTAERACYVVDVKSGDKVKVSASLPKTSMDFSWGPPIWDRAGEHVYLLDGFAGKLWEVSADGKQTRELAKIPGMSIRDMAVVETKSLYWSPDGGKTMYVRAHDDTSKKDAIFAVSLASGEATKLYDADESIGMREMGALTGLPAGGGTLIYSAESASRPEDVWAVDIGTGKARALSNLNPQYNCASLGKVRIIEWLSLAGEHLHGTLLMPAGYREGERYPLIVFVYGGDMGSDKGNRFAFGWGSAFNPQMWASRGYAVLYPDVPLHPGTPVDDLVSAVIPGVNKTVELGIVDPERLAVMGQSFGGYNTIALITRTNIFKAAISTSAATINLFEGYTSFQDGLSPWMGYYEEGQGGMHGTPWEFRQRYIDNSPIFFLDRVQTPLLLERGMMDFISTNSGNVFNSLRRLGKDVEFLEYEHEEHVLQQPANVIDFWNRRIEFVGRYLAPRQGGESKAAVVQ
jgi:dipeptidyl aminopeptidase/acylaminoacyl peptidase